MKAYFLKYSILFLLLFIVNSLCHAQTPQEKYLESEITERKIDKKAWEKTIEGINYDVVPKKEVEDYDEDFSGTNSPNQSNSSRSYSGGGGSSDLWAGFFKVLFIVLAIAAVALMMVHFLGAGSFTRPTNKKISKSNSNIDIENIEDHIYESDLDRFIREAIEGGNYALAIRLYYLAILKELSLNKTIRWKKDKTNREYLKEMRKTNMFQAFRESTAIFERVWYGKVAINASDFNHIKPKFEALVKAAQSKEMAKSKV